MDTTIISVLLTGLGTVLLTVTAMATLVTRSIGNLRGHMDQRIKGRLTGQPDDGPAHDSR